MAGGLQGQEKREAGGGAHQEGLMNCVTPCQQWRGEPNLTLVSVHIWTYNNK